MTIRLSVVRAACALVLPLTLLSGAAAAQDLRVVHHFGYPGGVYPDTDLFADGLGNLYGTTVQGGSFNSGTVFRLVPTGAAWFAEKLHEFTSTTDGSQPYGGVTLDAAGNVYGTAVVGGSWAGCPEDGCGVVWRLAQSPGGDWDHEVIHAFQGGTADGYGPGGPVVFDAQGNLYGMTATGGEFLVGVIYRLAPTPSGPWTESVIHHFTGGLDGGSGSKARLLLEPDGSFLGVATTGGAFGVGNVFRIAPQPGGDWKLTTLYSFQGDPDGVFPYGGLVRDAQGNLYGTTYYGGAYGVGTVYRLTGSGDTWTGTVLHSFADGKDGAFPISALAFGQDGALYGTTSAGGAGHGTIFRTHQMASGAWRTKVVHAFDGADGELPYSGVVVDPAGNLYGTAVHGGSDGDGTLFRFTP
jgi:uncharacterized repeat protein (TIGR03803 family)